MCNCQSKSSCGSHSSCGCESNSCACSCHQTGCGSSASCGSNQGSCDYAAKFLELANQAWTEVLKEKIKEKIKADCKNMDELAAIIADANHERWKHKMESKQCCGGYEEKLKNYFHQSCNTGSCQTQGQKK